MATRDNDDVMGTRRPGPAATSCGEEAEAQAAEQRRLQARRRFLKGGAAGSTAMILTLHHVPVEARWTDRDWNKSYGDKTSGGKKHGRKKKSTLMCDEPSWNRKRGVSICTSLKGQVAK